MTAQNPTAHSPASQPQAPRWESPRKSAGLLSLATAPFLLGLLSGRAIAEALTHLGLASEELFRGDRLPNLNPSTHNFHPNTPDETELPPLNR